MGALSNLTKKPNVTTSSSSPTKKDSNSGSAFPASLIALSVFVVALIVGLFLWKRKKKNSNELDEASEQKEKTKTAEEIFE